MTPLDAAGFAALFPVSRETLERLRLWAELLAKWNRRINLVGAATLADVWRRHILDSAQLVPLLPPGTRVVADLGSGAGLPGLILAILGLPEVHLIESDARKVAFLTEAARQTAAPARIHLARIEAAPRLDADVVTARALAPLAQLLPLAERLLRPGGMGLFLKGAQAGEELAAAGQSWQFEARRHPSLTDRAGIILQLESIARGRQ